MASSKSKTQTVATQFGETSVETVTCDSCGELVLKEDAREFVICDSYRQSRHGDKVKGVYSTGHVCQYCQDDPAAFPGAPSVVSQMADAVLLDDRAAFVLGFMLGALSTVSIIIFLCGLLVFILSG